MKKNTSFTLIELLVVIVIIGVIAGVIMVTVSSSVSNATFARAKAFSSNVQNSMLLNLVSEWTFDEGPTESGNAQTGDVRDTWENNDLSITGLPQIKNGNDCITNKCLQLSASDYLIKTEASIILKEITFEAWAKPTAINSDAAPVYGVSQIISYNSGNTGLAYISNNKFRFRTTTANDVMLDSQHTYALNEFYYVVGTYDGSIVKIYVNGVLENSRNDQTGNLYYNGTTHFFLVSDNSSQNRDFIGTIDDVRTYNAALSSSQIKQNYIAGLNSMLANGNISQEEYNKRISELASN
ncbi:MAG: LamG domain-containing protein [Candidatus Pacebacteria bacterium]|nr:LamG domain-containing protein [Candidatus Paceibacterota bacterium]